MIAVSAPDIALASFAGILALGVCALGIRESFKKKSGSSREGGILVEGGSGETRGSSHGGCDDAGVADGGGEGGGDGGGD